jgi:prenylcysteine oxidase/farnesylcysteine lyase
MRWEYGGSPARFGRAVRSVSKKWKAFGSDTFDNVAEALEMAGLDESINNQSGADYLTGLGISERFRDEVIQPCVRERFALNLTEVRGLDAIMACRESKETSVLEGNIRLIEEMITRSQAAVHLNTKVTNISHGQAKRYKLSITHTPSDISYPEYDIVIFTSPIHNPTGLALLTPPNSRHSFTPPA